MAKVVDVSSTLRFDLDRGALFAMAPSPEAAASGAAAAAVPAALEERSVVVSEAAFATVLAAAGPVACASAARQLGASMGKRIAQRLGGALGVRRAPLDEATSALAAEVCLSGLGRVALERWGDALVLVLRHAPRVAPTVLASVLEGAIEESVSTATGSGPSVACVVLDAGEELRVLVASASGAARVRTWLAEGIGWRSAIGRLQERQARPTQKPEDERGRT